MSFTDGNTSVVNCGDAISSLDDKVGSFIIFIWSDTAGAPTATFGLSRNNVECNVRRISCCRDSNGCYLNIEKKDGRFWLGTSEGNDNYPQFNVKILG